MKRRPAMHHHCTRLLFASLLAVLGVLTAGSAAFASPSQPHRPASTCQWSFVGVEATAAHTSGSLLDIDAGDQCSHDPAAFAFVTSDLTPDGSTFVPADPHPTGVLFNPFTGHWDIFNEDNAPMPLGAFFNVTFLGEATDFATPFLQQATRANINGASTIISNPLIDGQPNALLQVTANYGPSGVVDAHPLGVWYNFVTGHWAILHEDGTPIPLDAAYNVYASYYVLVAPNRPKWGFVHTATAATIGPNYTFLDFSTEGNDLWLVTPVQRTFCFFTPIGGGQVCNPAGPFETSPLAVGYFYGGATIFNTDGAAMYTNTSFHVIR